MEKAKVKKGQLVFEPIKYEDYKKEKYTNPGGR